MAHPMRQQALDDHNDKIKAMTGNYPGSPMKEKGFLRDNIKHGPEQQVAKRAEGGAVKHRADRRAVGGGVKKREAGGNVILRAKGGAAQKRADGGDVSSIEEANRDQKMGSDGKATGGAVQRARGGRTKKSGHTHVNVIVAPQGGGGAGAGAPPMGVHPVPPMIPPGAGPGMPPPGAGAMPPGPMAPRPPMMPPPGGMPPGGMPPGALATGGRVRRAAGGGVKDPGDRIGESMKAQGLKPSATGTHVKPGKAPKMEAGAMSGEGRLEKIGKEPRDAGKPQAV